MDADVLFLSTGTLGSRHKYFLDTYYEQTVGLTKPNLVIPVHWDNFFVPASDALFSNDREDGRAFNYLIDQSEDGTKYQFGFMQGFQSMMLFGEDGLGK